MSFNSVIEILIATAVMYFLFSTLVSIVYEWYSYKVQKRGRFLHDCISKLLNDPLNESYAALLYNQYSIDKLKKNKEGYPQYISSPMFADTLIDVIGKQSDELEFKNELDAQGNIINVEMIEKRISDPFLRFGAGLDKMRYSPLKSQLRSYFEKSSSYSELKLSLESWFNDYMSRVSGWYKNGMKKELFYISLVIAFALNIDSIRIITKIKEDSQLRKNLLETATQITIDESVKAMDEAKSNLKTSRYSDELERVKKITLFRDSISKITIHKADSVIRKIEAEGIPIGYQGDIKKIHGNWYIFKWLVGIFISAYAMSFGAPFWFEVIQKFINIRRAGTKH
jgi:hypothetical protein